MNPIQKTMKTQIKHIIQSDAIAVQNQRDFFIQYCDQAGISEQDLELEN